MLRITRTTIAAIGITALTGCAAMSVSSHVQRGLDVTQYRTYEWGPADALPTGDPRLDDNLFFQDYLEGAVEKQLARNGFERARVSDRPDLLIHYHASIDKRIDVNRIDARSGYCYTDDCRVRVVEYEAGTLVLDIVDARTNRVIWRGWAQDSVDGVLDDHDRLAKKIDEAVRRVLARFGSDADAGAR